MAKAKKRSQYKLLVASDGTPYIKKTRRTGRKVVRGGSRARIRIKRDADDNVVDWKIWVPFKDRSDKEKRRSSRRQLASCSLGARKKAFGPRPAAASRWAGSHKDGGMTASEYAYATKSPTEAAALTRAANRAAKKLCGPRAVDKRMPSGQAVAWMKHVGTPPPQVPGQRKRKRKRNPAPHVNPTDIVQAEMSDILLMLLYIQRAAPGNISAFKEASYIRVSDNPEVAQAAIEELKKEGFVRFMGGSISPTEKGLRAAQEIDRAAKKARKMNPIFSDDDVEAVLHLATMRRGEAPEPKKRGASKKEPKKKGGKAVTIGGVRIGGKKK